ncbi:DUF2683 family protein [Pseudopedobacter beijingensis]|uniref:DUF2683 family protein n=1 Tax=Pseudopedobacter beijingensis TaxID=1207056 RepID=A0ABW4I7A1_9SPHI
MKTLIVQPESKEQLAAIKAFLKALNVNFKANTVKHPANQFDFSDIAGKLEWEGDALKEQKKLRSEWD